MKIEEFLSTLPTGIISGKEINISDNVFRNIFRFADLSSRDIFFYLGFGNNSNALNIAKREFNTKQVFGIDDRRKFTDKAKMESQSHEINIINRNIDEINLSKATIIFFWFSNFNQIDHLVTKFENELMKNTRIITVLSPPGLLVPLKVEFPFILCKKPFKYANNIKEQIKAIYGNECLDFTACWLLSEKYIKKMEINVEYSRFTNMLMSIIIWINAWNMKATCEEEIPPPVQSYVGILRTFFNIDLKEMIVRK